MTRISACVIEVKIIKDHFFQLGVGNSIGIFIESDARYRKSGNWTRPKP